MFNKILVPVDIDYPETAAAVYQSAAKVAERSGTEIRLVSVMPGFGMPIVASYISDETRKEIVDRMKESLKTFIKNNCKESVSCEVRIGKNWEEIIKSADKWQADLIVVYCGLHHDISEVHSGSCTRRVAENATCSVLWLREILD